ncbi:alpha-amylase family glycosyl hydrolase, partial [Pseudomonas viridiflava]
RELAQFASWYELFPRSITDDKARHGTFNDVHSRLPMIRDMGFDVLYFPPIHPIGRAHRKGPNNSLTAGPDDPGSPYAIGSEDGGHEAIHPQLGSREDFRRLVAAAADHGLEIALDFAIQCSQDHPWLKQHPGWFSWRPDGTIRYAENPPKKYQDIVNVDFYAPDAIPGLWLELRDIVLGWVEEGVKIFRVDNPHTKPLPFWQWMIGEVRSQHPDVMFLAEAFTKPAMMARLGKVGYSQSYTYFTWRNTKAELSEYFTQLNEVPWRDCYRPNFFVNTPDINPRFLHESGRPGFLIRAALATMGSGLWGMYSGFELCEAAPIPGKEEYLGSEKYEIRVRDFTAPGNIIAEIAQLNRIRRQNPALQTHLGLKLLNAWNDNILYFGKRSADGSNFVLVAVNLDPHNVQEANFELPLWEMGLPDDAVTSGEDLMTGHRWNWYGKVQWMRIDPSYQPFGIWRIQVAQ